MPQLVAGLIIIAIIIYVIGLIFAFIASILIFVYHAFLYFLQLTWLGLPGGGYGFLIGASTYYLYKRRLAKDAIRNADHQILKEDSFDFETKRKLISVEYISDKKKINDWVTNKLAVSSETEIDLLVDSNTNFSKTSFEEKLKDTKDPKVKIGVDYPLWFSVISICTLIMGPIYLYKNPEFITTSVSTLKQQLAERRTNPDSQVASPKNIDEQGVVISSVNMRVFPNNKSKKIGVLSSGVKLKLLGFNETKKWIRVKVLTSNFKGKIGYVFGKYVKRNIN